MSNEQRWAKYKSAHLKEHPIHDPICPICQNIDLQDRLVRVEVSLARAIAQR